MGKRYLSLETSARFDFNDPQKFESGVDVERKGFLTEFKLDVIQRLIAADDASVNMNFGSGIKDIAPYYLKGAKLSRKFH